MHRVQRFGVAHQPVPLRQSAGRQGIGQLIHPVQGFFHLPAHHLVTQPLRQRVDRQQRARFLRPEYQGGFHLSGIKATAQFAVKEVFLPFPEGFHGVFCVKKGDLQRYRPVHRRQLIDRQAPADTLFPPLLRQQGAHRALLSRLRLGQRQGMR